MSESGGDGGGGADAGSSHHGGADGSSAGHHHPGGDGRTDTGAPVFLPPSGSSNAPTFVKGGAAPSAPGAPGVTGPSFVLPGQHGDGSPAFVKPSAGPSAVDSSRPWPWWIGPLAVAAALFGVVPLQAAIVAVIVATTGSSDFESIVEDNVHWFTLLQDVAWIALAVALPLLVVKHLRPAQLGLRKPPLLLAIGVFVGTYALFFVVSALYASVAGLSENDNTLLSDTGFGDSVAKDVLLAIVFTVGAPVAEELIFRGLLFRSLRDGLSKAWGPSWGLAGGSIISGVIFGAIHFGGGQNAFLPVLMALGILLALSYHWTGSIYVPMAIHSVNNTLATATNADPTQDWIYAVIVAGPVLTILLAVGLSRLIPRVCRAEPPGQPGAPPAGPPAAGPPPQEPVTL